MRLAAPVSSQPDLADFAEFVRSSQAKMVRLAELLTGVSRCPVLAVTYRARTMAPIGVQLVKDVPSLVNGLGWPARVS